MDEEVIIEPSKTYGILNGRVTGWIDELEAVKQSVEKILQTERFDYVIYSDNYGIELNHLIGESYDLVVAEIERVVKEALLYDERILSVDDFSIVQQEKNSLLITFIVTSIFGAFEVEQEVSG